MVTRRTALGLLAAAAIPVSAQASAVEPEFLRALVEAGTLPPMKERLPAAFRPVMKAMSASGCRAGTAVTSARSSVDKKTSGL